MTQSKEGADAQAAADSIDEVYQSHIGPIERLLGELREEFIEHGIVVQDIVNMSADGYCWSMFLGGFNAPGCIDVEISIPESMANDQEVEDGVSFRFELVRWGGGPLMVIQPFNYGDECWVHADDRVAVARRWTELNTQVQASRATIMDKIMEASECEACHTPETVCDTRRPRRCCASCHHKTMITTMRPGRD